MKLPTREEAVSFIRYAETRNEGLWVTHSFHVADACEKIALKSGLNSEKAYIMGLLHDIGRVEGVSYLHHIVSGYNFLCEKGYNELAEIALTHSFATQDINAYMGKWDCTADEIEFIKKFLGSKEYDEYDRLVQLCDTFMSAHGACLMEKRMVDVAMRYGTAELTHISWKKRFEIKKHFEDKMGVSIYSLFDDIVENTFGDKI
jgi:hypothetical protein